MCAHAVGETGWAGWAGTRALVEVAEARVAAQGVGCSHRTRHMSATEG